MKEGGQKNRPPVFPPVFIWRYNYEKNIKNKRKYISLLLVVAMVLSLGLIAFAGPDDEEPPSASTPPVDAPDPSKWVLVGTDNPTGYPVYEGLPWMPDGRPHYNYKMYRPDGRMEEPKGIQVGVIPGTDTMIYRLNVTFFDGQNRYFIYDNGRLPYYKETPSFKDVRETDWFYDAVMTMADEGIVLGYGDGTFQPNKPITIGEMAALICRIDPSVAVKSFEDDLKGIEFISPPYGLRTWSGPINWAHEYIMSLGWNNINQYPHWDPEACNENVMRGEAMKVAVAMAKKWINTPKLFNQ